MKLKNVIGIALMILSLAAMFFWESYGREKYTLSPVLVAAADIKEGSVVGAESFKLLMLPDDTLIDSHLEMADIGALSGMVARMDISANQQIKKDMLTVHKMLLPEGCSVFKIPGSWIYSRPAGLRAGDSVKLYIMPEKEYLGTFSIAYVRDQSEEAVLGLSERETVLSRNNASGVISSIEIIAKEEEYFSVFDAVEEAGTSCLLFVPEVQ